MDITWFRIGYYKKETLVFQWIRLQHIKYIGCCNLPRGFKNMQMHCGTYTKHSPGRKNSLTSLWDSGLPLKKWVLLWRFLLGVLLSGLNIQKWLIASLHCARCGGRSETNSHLLWTCSFTTKFVQWLRASLSHRFHGRRFGKHFWQFGQILCALSNNAYFLQWTRFWAL